MENGFSIFSDSPRSDSPPVDMERLLDDETGSSAASQNQMIILANQIIAAIPDRIKQSPAQTLDENNVAMDVSEQNMSH